MINSISFPPKARYYLSESYEEFRNLALTEARKIAQNYHAIYVFSDDEQNKELFSSELDLVCLMEEWVNNREDDCQSSIDVGEAMIRGIEQFVVSASWQFEWKYEGENNKPIMWFGLRGEKPEKGWILNLEDNSDTEFNWKDFWFPSDPWLNRVPDADESFLAWMDTECCSYLPSLEDVLKTCPIEVCEQDDFETLTRKIESLFKSFCKGVMRTVIE